MIEMIERLSLALVAFFIFGLATTVASANTHVLIIVGGGDKRGMYGRFYANLNVAAYDSEMQNWKVTIAVTDGKNEAQPKSLPATSKKDIQDAIKRAVSELKLGDKLIVYISDHGHPPDSVEDPMSSGLVLYGGRTSIWPPTLSHRELSELLTAHVPKGVSLVLIGDHCFSGGLHSVSAQLMNACSVSLTDFRTPSIAKIDFATKLDFSPFSTALWDETTQKKYDFDRDGKTSLYEAFYAGSQADFENLGRNQLSSFAYIDSVLKTGAYDPKSRNPNFFENLAGGIRGSAGLYQLPELGPAGSCTSDDLEKKFQALTRDLEQIDAELSFIRFRAEVGAGLPESFKQGHLISLKQLREGSKAFKDTVDGFIKATSALKIKWSKLGILQFSERKKTRAEYEKLKQDFMETISPWYNAYRNVVEMRKLEPFFKVATLEQKATLLRLIDCEAKPL